MSRKTKLPVLVAGLAWSSLAFSPVPGTAQNQAETQPAVKPGSRRMPGVIDRNHHLGPGDSVDIALEGFSEFTKSVTLFLDGTFDYPVIGSVQAAGLTTGELAEKVTELFRKELRKPKVTISIREIYVPPVITVEVKLPKIVALGSVNAKGAHEIPGPTPLRLVLAKIGPSDQADMAHIRVRYPDGTVRMCDFSMFGITGESKDDILIKGGEEIILVERPALQKADPIRFRILGEGVVRPGDVTTEGPLSLLGALEKVGGPKPGAELEMVEVTRPGVKEPLIVNLDAYSFGDVSANYVCQEGDIITVRTKANRVLLVGEVSQAGYRNIRTSDTLMGLILSAGGVNGDLSKTELIRRKPGNKVERQEIDVRQIMKDRKPDVQLAKDDVIFVPHKKIKRGPLYYLERIASPLWLIRSIAPVP